MKRALAVGLLALVTLGASITSVSTAHAHSELISSDPADGASLDAPPQIVSFTFNEPLLPDFVRFIATDPSGQTADVPVASVEGPTATIDWPADAPAGEWAVNYRVVSQDGHPIEGGITFAYAAASPSPAPSSSSAAPTSPSPTTATPTSAAPTPEQPSPTTSPAADTGEGGSSGLLIASLVVGAIVVIGVAVALVARRRA